MNKCKYAGLSLAGFLLSLICAAAILGGLVLLKDLLGVTLLAGLVICACIGVIFRLIRRFIRRKLHARTTLFSLISVLLPILLGAAGAILGANAAFSVEMVNSWFFLGGVVLIISSIFCGLFGSTLDKLFDA